jgi:hypothetical protein
MIPASRMEQSQVRKQKAMKRLQGMVDARGMQGIFSRGKNIYGGGAPQAQMGGGPQFGPPVGNQNAALQAKQAAMLRQGAGPGLATAPGQGGQVSIPTSVGQPLQNPRQQQYGINDLERMKQMAASAVGKKQAITNQANQAKLKEAMARRMQQWRA